MLYTYVYILTLLIPSTEHAPGYQVSLDTYSNLWSCEQVMNSTIFDIIDKKGCVRIKVEIPKLLD